MSNCTQCGADLKEGVRFCTSCGAPHTADFTPDPPRQDEPPLGAKIAPPPERPASTETKTAPPSSHQPASQTQRVFHPAASPAADPPQHAVYQPPVPPAYQQPPAAQPYAPDAPPPGSKYALISTKGFLGIMLLMCIPILGQILMIVWACGGCRKLQKRNLARAGLILLVISLILSLILGFAFRGALKGVAGEADGEGGTSSGSILGRLLGGGSSGAEQTGSDAGGELDDLTALAGLLNGLSAGSGEDAGGSLEALLENAADVNREAERHSDGWPSSLPEYPGGAMSAVESYRTEFTGTTREEMHAYIDTLKNDGFAYTDFYGFGMTEAEMLDIDGWWGTDGNLYLSLSYLDGTVTIDHTTELPNLEDYFS